VIMTTVVLWLQLQLQLLINRRSSKMRDHPLYNSINALLMFSIKYTEDLHGDFDAFRVSNIQF
jgi:hypothetical protein